MITQGIVIRSVPYGDRDLILTVLSVDLGKLGLFTKFGRSKTSSTCEVFDYCSFEVTQNKGMDRLKRFTPIKSFPALRSRLETIACGSFICEAFDFLIPESDTTDADELFQLLLTTLTDLARTNSLKDSLKLTFFAIKGLLNILGLIELESESTPSLNNLLRLVNIVESQSERALKTKQLLFSYAREAGQKAN